MQIRTILNKVYKFKSFIYGNCEFDKEGNLIVDILPRKNGKALCSTCFNICPLYDRLNARLFEFIPVWGLKIFFRYLTRRVSCTNCGIKVEALPWANGKNTCTIPFQLVLADFGKSLSWEETARRFKVSWGKVFRSVEYVVDWGLKNRDLTDIFSIGIDEISWKVGHSYLTLVYQIDEGFKRLLWIGENRNVKTLLRFFNTFGREKSSRLKYICSDMWKPYLKVIKRKASQAIHILDRFHIIQKLNKSIDEVRAEEYKKMKTDGYEPILSKSMMVFT